MLRSLLFWWVCVCSHLVLRWVDNWSFVSTPQKSTFQTDGQLVMSLCKLAEVKWRHVVRRPAALLIDLKRRVWFWTFFVCVQRNHSVTSIYGVSIWIFSKGCCTCNWICCLANKTFWRTSNAILWKDRLSMSVDWKWLWKTPILSPTTFLRV